MEGRLLSRYDKLIDPSAPNDAHALALGMVGWNQRVLELGASSGHVTRALAAQRCRVTAVEYDAQAATAIEGAAETLIVGDLNDAATLAALPGDFDVCLAGDVLEHLIDPLRVLSRMAQLLAPGGRVVVSLPHVAHADLRLALLQGRFDYHSWGLLDRTHLRFFTLKTLRQMVKQAGLMIVDMRRVRIPAFETELAIDRQSVATAVLDEIMSDPEAETYQFVFTAVRDDGDSLVSRLASVNEELRDENERLVIATAVERSQARALTRQLHRLRSSKTFRYTHWPRMLYSKLRRGR